MVRARVLTGPTVEARDPSVRMVSIISDVDAGMATILILLSLTVVLVASTVLSLDIVSFIAMRQQVQDSADSVAASGAGETFESINASSSGVRVEIDSERARIVSKRALDSFNQGQRSQTVLVSQSCVSPGAGGGCERGWAVTLRRSFPSLSLRFLGVSTDVPVEATAVGVPEAVDAD